MNKRNISVFNPYTCQISRCNYAISYKAIHKTEYKLLDNMAKNSNQSKEKPEEKKKTYPICDTRPKRKCKNDCKMIDSTNN
jgi:hypothetical protein